MLKPVKTGPKGLKTVKKQDAKSLLLPDCEIIYDPGIPFFFCILPSKRALSDNFFLINRELY